MSFLEMDDGINIYYEDLGEGEPLIFAHDLNSSLKANTEFYEYFRKDFRIILYNQRGHGESDRPMIHMNIERLGQDLNELIKALNLDEVTLIGHSMGGTTIYNYINQFGCGKVKRIVISDMSPYMRNKGWSGGIGMGNWSDDDFMCDFDRLFDNVGHAAFHISSNLMDTNLLEISEDDKNEIIEKYAKTIDTFTMASLWFSLFKTDKRSAVKKIEVPLMYIMPEKALYSMEAVSYIKENVNDKFVLKSECLLSLTNSEM